MLTAIRAEWRKLLTVRSTYILSAVALLIVGFVSFWVVGARGATTSPLLVQEAVKISGISSIFIAIVAILLMTHEYRHNTIMYTLIASNSRSKVLAAKLLVVTVYATVFTVVAGLLSAGLATLGAQFAPNELVAQQFYFWDTSWRVLFGSVGYAWAGLLFGVLLRHVAGALVVFFIVPSTIEELAALWLKENAKYLPFTAHSQVQLGDGLLLPGKAALVFSAYLVVGWIIAWYLFVRRDAN